MTAERRQGGEKEREWGQVPGLASSVYAARSPLANVRQACGAHGGPSEGVLLEIFVDGGRVYESPGLGSEGINLFGTVCSLPWWYRQEELAWIYLATIPAEVAKKQGLARMAARVLRELFRDQGQVRVWCAAREREVLIKPLLGPVIADQQGEQDLLDLKRNYDACWMCHGMGALG